MNAALNLRLIFSKEVYFKQKKEILIGCVAILFNHPNPTNHSSENLQ